MSETWPPPELRFRTRGRIDAEALRHILAEGRGLVADHAWWCGAPVLTEEKKSAAKARGRIRGEVTLRFGWVGAPGSELPAEDDHLMAGRDASYLLERLRRWSETHAVRWEIGLPGGDEASIAEGHIDRRLLALLDQRDAGPAPRATTLLERHVDRHRGIDVPAWSSVGVVARKEHLAFLARSIHLVAEGDAEVVALGQQIRLRRDCGQVWFGVWQAPSCSEEDPRTIADRVVSGLGLAPLGAHWLAVTRAEAEAILVCVLCRDMAYDTQLMAGEQACRLASRFLLAFSEDAQIFSNARVRDGRVDGWTYLVSGATFEGGIVMVSAGRTGILWVGDED